jgi:hypothetical protein
MILGTAKSMTTKTESVCLSVLDDVFYAEEVAGVHRACNSLGLVHQLNRVSRLYLCEFVEPKKAPFDIWEADRSVVERRWITWWSRILTRFHTRRRGCFDIVIFDGDNLHVRRLKIRYSGLISKEEQRDRLKLRIVTYAKEIEVVDHVPGDGLEVRVFFIVGDEVRIRHRVETMHKSLPEH